MSEQHDNLAVSMLHFLSGSPDARIFCIAGFHTGRARMAPFFEEVAPKHGLEIEDIYEIDTSGTRREWRRERSGVEDVGERNKWLVVARLRRRAES
jgi:nicotinamide N-methyltransferase